MIITRLVLLQITQTNTTLTPDGLVTNRLVSQDNIVLDNANISMSTNADIVLTATGNVVIGNYAINVNTITNTGLGNMVFS